MNPITNVYLIKLSITVTTNPIGTNPIGNRFSPNILNPIYVSHSFLTITQDSLPELVLIDTIFSLFIIIIINYINSVNKFYILCFKTS
ncbi:unnamed protein product [Rhizophagus irregularis]|nr:unnamed protein product [Rhizophagus irregularis]CAB5378332.1 unnamed protein product [Rhizophagus irregularis]